MVKPSILLDPEVLVFESEPQIYSDCPKLNHQLASSYLPRMMELHQNENQSLLLSMVVEASTAEFEAANIQGSLPGQYVEPNPEVKSILSELQPHNDKTESVFGANDWLNTVLPNMSQSTRSCMLEFAYNKTMEWLKTQSREQTQTLIALAQERKTVVQQ